MNNTTKCLIVAMAVTTIGSASANACTFRLGLMPSPEASTVQDKAKELVSYLEKQIGCKVKLTIPTSYEPIVEALRFKNLEAAFLDGSPGYLAVQRAGAKVVLAEVRDDGKTSYDAVAWVKKEAPAIKGLKDLLGKRLAHTSITGSSGFVVPIGTMLKSGYIKPKGKEFFHLEQALQKSFKANLFTGSYEASLQLLLQGKVDVAFGGHDAAQKFLSPADQKKVRIGWKFGRVPAHNIVVGKGLSPALEKKFVTAMLGLSKAKPGLYRSLYGVEGVKKTDTKTHFAGFGPLVDKLTGLHSKMMGK